MRKRGLLYLLTNVRSDISLRYDRKVMYEEWKVLTAAQKAGRVVEKGFKALLEKLHDPCGFRPCYAGLCQAKPDRSRGSTVNRFDCAMFDQIECGLDSTHDRRFRFQNSILDQYVSGQKGLGFNLCVAPLIIDVPDFRSWKLEVGGSEVQKFKQSIEKINRRSRGSLCRYSN